MVQAEFSLVLTTVPAETDADVLAATLVAERVAACVSVLPPMQSIYRWQGSVERATERLLLIKTASARVPDLQRRLAELHPYEVPECLVLAIAGGSPAYLAWLAQSMEPPDAS